MVLIEAHAGIPMYSACDVLDIGQGMHHPSFNFDSPCNYLCGASSFMDTK